MERSRVTFSERAFRLDDDAFEMRQEVRLNAADADRIEQMLDDQPGPTPAMLKLFRLA